MTGIARATYRVARRIVIGVVGGTLVLVGIVLIFTPGPAFVVLPAGLGVLALEFAWARRWLKRLRAMVTPSSQVPTADAGSAPKGEADAKLAGAAPSVRRGANGSVPLS